MDQRLNVRAKAIKYRDKSSWLQIWNRFSDLIPKAQATKRKNNNKLDFIRIKNFCASKGIILSMWKKNPTEWKKIFVDHILNKGLVSKIYKEFIQQQKDKPTKHGKRVWIDMIPKKDTQSQDVQLSLAIKETQNYNENTILQPLE